MNRPPLSEVDDFRRLVDLAPDAILVVDAAGTIVLANSRAGRHAGTFNHALHFVGKHVGQHGFRIRSSNPPATRRAANTRRGGDFRVLVKKENQVVEFVVDHHPFDVVG